MHLNVQIEWLERLDGDRTSQSGPEGYVFKVKIKSRLYTLKAVGLSLNNLVKILFYMPRCS